MPQIVISEQDLTVSSSILTETEQIAITVSDSSTRIVTVSERGPQGAKGDKGDPGGIYVHEQATPSASWTVTHNLNAYPVPQIVDSAGNTVEGDITYVSANTLTISFSSAFAGKIFLAF